MLAPSILASVTNSLRFDILDPSLNAIEQLPFAAHCALLWVSTMSPATCPPCPRYVQSPPAGPAASSLPNGRLLRVASYQARFEGLHVRQRDAAGPAGGDASVPTRSGFSP